VPIYYLANVLRLYTRVPNVVGVDKDDGSFFVAAGTGVAEHGCRRYAAPVYLFPESFEQFGPALRTAAPFTRSGAHEDLAESTHTLILLRGLDKSNAEAIREPP
jgi:hypothetical protein